jgi:hypothetical protein
MVYRLQELILRIDGNAHTTAAAGAGAGGTPAKGGAVSSAPRVGLHAHLERENVQFIHFAFRWMGCLLMRELRLPLIFRLWDSYLSEGATVAAGFKVLHVYVCAAFLMRWSEQLKKMDFQQIIQFLQKLPTGQSEEQRKRGSCGGHTSRRQVRSVRTSCMVRSFFVLLLCCCLSLGLLFQTTGLLRMWSRCSHRRTSTRRCSTRRRSTSLELACRPVVSAACLFLRSRLLRFSERPVPTESIHELKHFKNHSLCSV